MSKSIIFRINRKTRRTLKIGSQWLRCFRERQHGIARVVFVLGVQRSGTRVPLLVMERSPDIITYSEGHSRAFNGSYLRNNHELTQLLLRSRFPVVGLKPICESHRCPELLQSFPGSKAIWIYRDFRDTVTSSVAKWQHGRLQLQRIMSALSADEEWQIGGLMPEKLALVQELYHQQISSHSAFALRWYLRQGLFFDLGLHQRDDVLLVKYEDLVTSPQLSFQRLFDFIDLPFSRKFVKTVHQNSVGRKSGQEIEPEIQRLCRELYQRTELCYGHNCRATNPHRALQGSSPGKQEKL